VRLIETLAYFGFKAKCSNNFTLLEV